MERRAVLITNDDGVTSRGIKQLARAFREAGAVVRVVAPDAERSAVSHAISLTSPLRMRKLGEEIYAVSGTPADCTYMGIYQVFPTPPEIVVSGINSGYNLGTDVFYSGTFAAALEAVFRGVPGLAVSCARGVSDAVLRRCAQAAVGVARKILTAPPQPGVVYNMNHPETSAPRSVRLCSLGVRQYKDGVEVRRDPKGVPYYWIGGSGTYGIESLKGGEHQAIKEGYIALTPLRPMAISDPGHEHLSGEV